MHHLVIFVAKYFVFIPPIIWLGLLWKLPKSQRLQFIVFSAVSAIITAILVKIATTVHQDARPFMRDHVHPYFTSSTDNGFPSDHTVLSSLLALLVLRYSRVWGIFLAIVTICVGATRVISGVHHSQDIVGGIVIAALSVAIAFAAEKLYVRLKAKMES